MVKNKKTIHYITFFAFLFHQVSSKNEPLLLSVASLSMWLEIKSKRPWMCSGLYSSTSLLGFQVLTKRVQVNIEKGFPFMLLFYFTRIGIRWFCIWILPKDWYLFSVPWGLLTVNSQLQWTGKILWWSTLVHGIFNLTILYSEYFPFNLHSS
jgi:hypothetical protein